MKKIMTLLTTNGMMDEVSGYEFFPASSIITDNNTEDPIHTVKDLVKATPQVRKDTITMHCQNLQADKSDTNLKTLGRLPTYQYSADLGTAGDLKKIGTTSTPVQHHLQVDL